MATRIPRARHKQQHWATDVEVLGQMVTDEYRAAHPDFVLTQRTLNSSRGKSKMTLYMLLFVAAVAGLAYAVGPWVLHHAPGGKTTLKFGLGAIVLAVMPFWIRSMMNSSTNAANKGYLAMLGLQIVATPAVTIRSKDPAKAQIAGSLNVEGVRHGRQVSCITSYGPMSNAGSTTRTRVIVAAPAAALNLMGGPQGWEHRTGNGDLDNVLAWLSAGLGQVSIEAGADGVMIYREIRGLRGRAGLGCPEMDPCQEHQYLRDVYLAEKVVELSA